MSDNFIEVLENNIDLLSEKILKYQLDKNPDLKAEYDDRKKFECKRDIKYHLNYLKQAVINNEPEIFTDYTLWTKVLLKKHDVGPSVIENNYKIIIDVLINDFEIYPSSKPIKYLKKAIDNLNKIDTSEQNYIKKNNPLKNTAKEYLNFVLNAKKEKAINLILNKVKNGTKVKNIYLYVFQPAQYEIGKLWHNNEISVAQEHYSTAITQLIMSHLYSYILNPQESRKKLLAASIGEELHEIGIRMVADFFEMEGWDTYYYGANTPQNAIINAIEKYNIDLVSLSVTMAYHLEELKSLIKSIRHNKKTSQVKIIVGGYIFNQTPELWKKVGADGYAEDAEKAIQKANKLIKKD